MTPRPADTNRKGIDMPLAFQNVTVTLPVGTGRRDIQLTRSFGAPFASDDSVDAAIKGFSLDYAEKDHHINIAAVDVDVLSVRRAAGEVDFLVQVLFADKNLDDPYTGFVNVLLIAELEAGATTGRVDTAGTKTQ